MLNIDPDNKSDSRNPENKKNSDIVDRENRVNSVGLDDQGYPVFEADDNEHFNIWYEDAGIIDIRNPDPDEPAYYTIPTDLVGYGASFNSIGDPARELNTYKITPT